MENLTVMAAAASDIPFPVNQDPGKTSLESILDNRMLSVRNPVILSIFRLQSTVLRCFSEYLRSQGFTEIKTSKLIGTGTEGGTGLFAVEYFDTKVYLTQSPQIYKQAMIASGLERVFEIGPAYRAEKHDTPRHINEFVSLDLEIAFVESEQELMDLEARRSSPPSLPASRSPIRTSSMRGRPPYRIPLCARRSPGCPMTRHKRLWGRDWQEGLRDRPRGRARPVRLGLEDGRHRGGLRVRLPAQVSSLLYIPAENNRTKSFDLLFRGLEVTSGSVRINSYDLLVENLKAFGLNPEGFSDYLSIFKYGCPPHGGFAIGLERLTQKILGLTSVKEATLFPRDRKRIRP